MKAKKKKKTYIIPLNGIIKAVVLVHDPRRTEQKHKEFKHYVWN